MKTKTIHFAVAAVLFLAFGVSAQEMSGHHHVTPPSANNADLESVQEWAKSELAKSPRHHEWVKIKVGDREVNSFVVYPQTKKKATAVVVIHEIYGLSDWVQRLTDELAEAGYIAIAPDLLSGKGPNGGGTSDVATLGNNAVGTAIRDLPPDQVTADLNAAADYVSKLPAANGKLAVGGFCWGGTQTFRFATNRKDLKGAFVFYGSAPQNNAQGQPFSADRDALARIAAPVYGFYAENDMRINATVPPTQAAMADLKKKYDVVTYPGAGHGFMRQGEPNAPPPAAPVAKGDEAADKKANDDYQKALEMYKANRKARDAAWVRWKALLAKI
jgi:carboxymethylenebutenolidase